jgi:cytoskeletal protein CcmA (bactofilin family)
VLVGPGARFEGIVTFRGAARLDGALRGEIFAEGGLLLIGPAACVEARIRVGELVVEGDVEGDVDASTRVEVGPCGVVRGRRRTPRVAVADGGRLEGRCETASGAASGDPSRPASEPSRAAGTA